MAYQRVTLAEFRQNLQETYESVPFWTDQDANIAINETLRWWNFFTGQWRKTEVLQLLPGVNFYDLSSTLVLPANVRFQGYPLDLSALTDLDLARPNWQAESIYEPGCPSRPSVWAPHGMKTIAVWPMLVPGTAAQLEIDGVRNTPVLVQDSDFIDLGEDEFNLFYNEALYLILFKEGGPRWMQAQQFHQAFIKAALDKNSRLKASAKFRKWAGIDANRGMRPFRVPVADPTQGQGGQQQ